MALDTRTAREIHVIQAVVRRLPVTGATENFELFINNDPYAQTLCRALAGLALDAPQPGLAPREDLILHLKAWAGVLTTNNGETERAYWKFHGNPPLKVVAYSLFLVDWELIAATLLNDVREARDFAKGNTND